MSVEAITLRDLSFSYPGQTGRALSGVTLTVGAGEFVVLCGASGGGKTTLLRLLKPSVAPHGAREGEILFFGAPVDALDRRRESAELGLVRQSPDDQLVTDKVWHELAFGLESLGCDTGTIRRRVAETASFFGLGPLFRRKTAELSGGQKQLVNLAAVMTLRPRVLLLDEPTAQLDPLAVGEFLRTLARLSRELGVTVLLSEQRLEEALPLADRALVLERGRLIFDGPPRAAAATLRAAGSAMRLALPASARLWAAVGEEGVCPLTVREGQDFLSSYAKAHPLAPLPPAPERVRGGEPVLAASNLSFAFDARIEVLRDLSFNVCKGEILAVLGANGSGKTTLLRLLAGALTPAAGRVERRGRVALLPQEPQLLFTAASVGEELAAADAGAVSRVRALCGLAPLWTRHPYDLSGGEQQRLALAKLLLHRPDVLLLDEPTKGMDAAFKRRFAALLETLSREGTAVVLVSHDVAFCARAAHRCALLFDGALVASGPPRRFFSDNAFYTTAARRVAGALVPEAVTAEDLIAVCGGTEPVPEEPSLPLPAAEAAPSPAPPPLRRAPLPARTRAALAFDLLLIPLTLLLGVRFLGAHYVLLALALALEAMLPFFLAFEGRRPSARLLVTIAALCALGVAGRAAFFMLQQFKPVVALVTVAGAALGGEAGFLVGALTMLLSNVLFGQGPWTPFQMFAMGLIGLLAGLLFRPGGLRPRRGALCAYGAFAALVVYGGIMNPVSALLAARTLTWANVLAFYVTGLPMDLVQTAATVLFLWFAGEGMLAKLARLKTKYPL